MALIQHTNPLVFNQHAWTGNNNWTIVQGGECTSTNTVDWITKYLDIYYWGFNIPAQATLTGIKFDIDMKSTDPGNCVDWSVKIDYGQAVYGTEHNHGSGIPLTYTTISYGGDGDDWGAGLTIDNLNFIGFGIAVAINGLANVAVYVKNPKLTIYYTVPTSILPQYYAA